MIRQHATDVGARQGFTTTEVMVAVALSLILSVIAVAGMQIYQRESPVRGAASRLMHTFATARTYAVANNSYYAVRIDAAHRNFWIDETDATGGTMAPKVTSTESLGDRVALDSIRLGNTAVQGGQVVSLSFAPDGHSDDAAIYLRLEGAPANDMRGFFTVKLYGPTGQGQVFEAQRLSPDGITP